MAGNHRLIKQEIRKKNCRDKPEHLPHVYLIQDNLELPL